MTRLPVISGDWVSLGGDDDYVSVDDAMNKVFEQYGLEKLGGASGRGWSWYQTMQRCWHLYKHKYVVEGSRYVGRPGKSLEVGGFMHALLATYYQGFIQEDYPLTPDLLYDGVLDLGADAARVGEAYRLYNAYITNYSNDYIVPLAVEQFAEDPKTGNTCRYDGIVRIDEPPIGIMPGTYVLEHKSAARFDELTLEGWKNDGEIIGQMMIWREANLEEIYGPCRGVIVNIIGKQAVPKFERVIIPPQAWQLDAHMRDLAFWRASEANHRVSGHWPRSRASCVTKFGKCELFDICSSGADDEE